MVKKYKKLIYILLCFCTAGLLAKNIHEHNYGLYDTESEFLKSTHHQGKLMETPEGFGTQNMEFGSSVAIYENRALISAPILSKTGAVYVMEFDGNNWIESDLLIADDIGLGDIFGISVSLFENRALIGAVDSLGIGSAYIYDFDGVNWNQTQKLTVSDGFPDSDFGFAVSLFGDMALIGARNDNENGEKSGATYAFKYDGNTWLQIQKITPNNVIDGRRFGSSISQDGNKVIIGALEDFAFPRSGSAFVFEFDGQQWNQIKKLVASDGESGDQFGYSVSLKGDIAAVGAIYHNTSRDNAGAAYIFNFDGMKWNESQKIKASNDRDNDFFGNSISLTSNSVVVGAFQHSNSGVRYGGAVYVFEFNGVNWEETFYLFDPDASNFSQFGISISTNGGRILIGANQESSIHSGAAYVYEFDGISWGLQEVLNPIDSPNDNWFGYSVSLNGDKALVGAPLASINKRGSGAAYIFEGDNGKWHQTHKLFVPEGIINENFGESVSLYGGRALIGTFNDSGAVYVFDFDGVNWVLAHKITPDDNIKSNGFGEAVSLNESRILVGASYDDGKKGAVYVFDYNGSNWVQTQKLKSLDIAFNDRFGSAVSLLGNRALIGASFDNDAGDFSGSAYVFDFDGGSWIQSQKLTADDAATGDHFGYSVSLSADKALIGAYKDNDNGGNSGSAYIFDFNDPLWIQSQKLTARDVRSGDHFGSSVSFTINRAVIGAYKHDSDLVSNSGAVYVYDFNGAMWRYTEKLTAPDSSQGGFFGFSVSHYGSLALVGKFKDDENGDSSGAAYLIYSDDIIFLHGF